MGTAKIKLDKDLFEKVKKYARLAGYSSADEFVTHCLEKELARRLESVVDPLTGVKAISKAYLSENCYHGSMTAQAPDSIVG